MSNRMIILGWHNVDPTPFYPASPAEGRRGFERQLDRLARVGTVVPLGEALSDLQDGRPLPPRSVALTFDDGYRDWLDVIVPALDRRGMHGTFFLITELLSGTITGWWEDLAHAVGKSTVDRLHWDGQMFDLSTPTSRRRAVLDIGEQLSQVDRLRRVASVSEIAVLTRPFEPAPELFMDWADARTLAAGGHDIGSHTTSHVVLSREDRATQAVEITDSRRALQEALGRPIDVLAYPHGTARDYNADSVALARSAGYRAAVTTRPGVVGPGQNPFELRRLVLTPHSDVSELAGKAVRKGARTAGACARHTLARLTER